MWVATQDLPRSAAHPFYTRLNQILDDADFDEYVESLCQRFYADEIGRAWPAARPLLPSAADWYFEGLDAERAIAWRAADSLRSASYESCSRPWGSTVAALRPQRHNTPSKRRRL